MDNSTRRMINSLAEDVLSAYNISVPIGNIDEIVEKLGGTIQKEAFFSDGAVEKEGNGFKIIVSPFQDEKRERDYQFGLDSSMNLDKEALGQYPTDSISFLASSNKERAMSVE